MSLAVLLGEGELADGTVSIKDLRTGSEAREGITSREAYRSAGTVGQQTVPRQEMADAVKRLLGIDGTRTDKTELR